MINFDNTYTVKCYSFAEKNGTSLISFEYLPFTRDIIFTNRDKLFYINTKNINRFRTSGKNIFYIVCPSSLPLDVTAEHHAYLRSKKINNIINETHS
jgi:hypothetical protein